MTRRTHLALTLNAAVRLAAQTGEEYRVYSESPRLLLRPQRLRLVKRERDRQTMRWEQFNGLMAGHAQMPEPGFAAALYYAVTGERDFARQALAAASDVRQMAIVLDWCRPAMTETEAKAAAARLVRSAAALAGKTDFISLRDRAFAAIATADLNMDSSEAALKDIIHEGWRNGVVPRLRAGEGLPAPDGLFALYELMHVVRDNLTIDLREDAPAWFKPLPPLHLLSNYPAPYPSPENEYWIPAFDANKAPDLRLAALARAAGFAMVAYDSNALDSQFLQGWLMQDRFLMRSAFGSPYEFLLANPYQPGLSYDHFPLAHHDPLTGGLFVRSSWEPDATWFGRAGSEWQLFQDGKITALAVSKPREPIVLGATTVYFARERAKFAVKEATRVYVTGLTPHLSYAVEVDDEEIYEDAADAAGTVAIAFSEPLSLGIRVASVR